MITVIKSDDHVIHLTEAERALKYAEMAKIHGIDDYHIDNLLHMESTFRPKIMSSVPLMLKQLSRYVTYVAPINRDISKPEKTQKIQPINIQLDEAVTIINKLTNSEEIVSRQNIIRVVEFIYKMPSRIDYGDRANNLYVSPWHWFSAGYTMMNPIFPQLSLSANFTATKENIEKAIHVYQWLDDFYHSSVHYMVDMLTQNVTRIKSTHRKVETVKSKYPKELDKLTTEVILQEYPESCQLNLLRDLYSLNLLHVYNMMINGQRVDVEGILRRLTNINIIRKNTKQKFIDVIRVKQLRDISMEKYKKEYRLLNSQEQKLVLSAYAKKQRIISLEYPDTTDLHADVNTALRAFDKLLAYDKQSEIKLKDVICEHLFLYLSKLKANPKQDTGSLQREIIKDYGIGSVDLNSYFCRICGEEIGIIEEESVIDRNQMVNLTDDTSETDRALYSTIANTVNSKVSLELGKNPKTLIRNVYLLTKGFVDDLENKLMKIKTNTIDIIENSLSVFMIIYTYAGLIYVFNKIKGASFKGLKKSNNPLTFLKDAMQFSLDNITTYYSNEIIGAKMSSSTVKSQLFLAYKIISSQTASVEAPEMDNIIYIFIISDPLFHFIFRMECVKHKRMLSYADVIKKIVIAENKHVYSEIKPDLKITNDESQVLITNYKLLLDYYINVSNERVIPHSPVLANFYEKSKQIMAVENTLINTGRRLGSRPKALLPFKESRAFHEVDVDLSQYYYKAKRIEWDVFVVVDTKTKKKIELTNADMNKAIGTPEYYRYEIVDYKSSKGNIYKSHTNKAEAIADLKFATELESFYNFFRFRCPIATIHTFVEGKCKNCGITYDDVKNHNLAYYKKYKNKQIEHGYKGKLEYGKWSPTKQSHKFDSSSVAKVAKMFNIEYNILYNLGYSEKLDYNLLKKREVNPAESKATDDRILRLFDYLNTIIIIDNISRVDSKKYNYSAKVKLETISIDKKFTMETQELINLLLETIFSNILLIAKDNRDSAEFVLNKIMRRELLFSAHSEQILKENAQMAYEVTAGEQEYNYDNENDEFEEEDYDNYEYEGADMDDEELEENVSGGQDW